MDGFSPNLHRICILDTFQSLLKMGDLGLHLQGHLGKKHGNWLGLTCMINHGVNFSPTAFILATKRVHIGMFNISSGFFEIQKLKKSDGFRNLGPISHFTCVNICLSAL